MTSVAVMGSTGSIGTQTLDIVDGAGDRFDVVALGAGRSVDALADQVERFRPSVVVVADGPTATALADRVDQAVEILVGDEGLGAASTFADIVINGVVGFAGLPVTLAALGSGRRLGLANKESLIAAGPVVQAVRDTPGAELVPVDSEHCALHQCLRANDVPERVDQLVLTASGGPFRGWAADALAEVTVEQALAHPTWSMGPKVTVDSSTLMNKGLEVIEAHELFGIEFDHIDVVVHPQSIVHSMVTYTDGATIAQLSLPDMRLCIGYALAHPDRLDTPYGRIEWSELSRLDFEPPDRTAFPCLDLAYAAGRSGGTAPAWLNAANEVAVAAFLEGLISWRGIADVIADVLDTWDGASAETVDDVIRADGAARAAARRRIETRAEAT